MRGFFDASVLVPVFYGDHVHHQASLARFVQSDKSTGCCGARSLAEVYSTLTRMPGKHRISGEQAKAIYSWNGRHYMQCGPEVTRRLRTP
jgi:predicted nucleic acid-binding protein